MRPGFLLTVFVASLLAGVGEAAFSNCREMTSCGICNGQINLPDCGFCVDNGKCLTGDSSGPLASTCTDWIFTRSRIITVTSSQVVIFPDYFDVELRPGVPVYLNITVVPQPMPLDLTILTDVSKSMDARLLNNLRAVIQNVIDQIKFNVMNDTIVGLAAFLDKPNIPFAFWADCTTGGADECVTPGSPACSKFTDGCAQYVFDVIHKCDDDTATLQAALNALVTTGNLDWPEAMLDGLLHTTMCGADIGWRRNTRHLVLVATDADFQIAGSGLTAGILRPNNGDCTPDRGTIQAQYHDDSAYNDVAYPHSPPGTGEDFASIHQLRDRMIEKNVYPVFATYYGDLGEKGPDNQVVYEALIKEWGFGVLSELDAAGTNIYSAIEVGYRNASLEVVMRAGGDTYGYVTYIDPPDGYRGADKVIDGVPLYFNVTLYTPGGGADDSLVLNVLGWGEVNVDVHAGLTCDCGNVTCPVNTGTGPEAGLVCSGRGYCDCGLCVCDAGWTGRAC